MKPGDILKEELQAREWTQKEFAEIIGRPVQVVNEIIAGKKAITPETACLFSAAFGTSAELWLNLENSYRLRLLETMETSEVSHRARQLEERAAKSTGTGRRPSKVPFRLDVLVEQHEDAYVAHCLQLDIVSRGSTERDAIAEVMESVKTCLTARIDQGDSTCGFKPAPPEAWLKLWRVYEGEHRQCVTKRIDLPARVEAVICRAT